MIKLAGWRKRVVLLIWGLDRLSRSQIEAIDIFDELDQTTLPYGMILVRTGKIRYGGLTVD